LLWQNVAHRHDTPSQRNCHSAQSSLRWAIEFKPASAQRFGESRGIRSDVHVGTKASIRGQRERSTFKLRAPHSMVPESSDRMTRTAWRAYQRVLQ